MARLARAVHHIVQGNQSLVNIEAAVTILLQRKLYQIFRIESCDLKSEDKSDVRSDTTRLTARIIEVRTL